MCADFIIIPSLLQRQSNMTWLQLHSSITPSITQLLASTQAQWKWHWTPSQKAGSWVLSGSPDPAAVRNKECNVCESAKYSPRGPGGFWGPTEPFVLHYIALCHRAEVVFLPALPVLLAFPTGVPSMPSNPAALTMSLAPSPPLLTDHTIFTYMPLSLVLSSEIYQRPCSNSGSARALQASWDHPFVIWNFPLISPNRPKVTTHRKFSRWKKKGGWELSHSTAEKAITKPLS